jgi:hypothetical protein
MSNGGSCREVWDGMSRWVDCAVFHRTTNTREKALLLFVGEHKFKCAHTEYEVSIESSDRIV